MPTELIVADQASVRGTAEHAVLFFIHFFKKSALVEFGRPLQVFAEIVLRNVQHPNLELGAGFSLIH